MKKDVVELNVENPENPENPDAGSSVTPLVRHAGSAPFTPDERTQLIRSCESGMFFMRIPRNNGSPVKAPKLKGWNLPLSDANPHGYTASAELVLNWVEDGDNIGLALLPSGVVSLDIDNLDLSREVFESLELPLDEWLNNPGRLEIISGKPGKAKLLFRVSQPEQIPCSRQLPFESGMVFELRFCSGKRTTMQDVYPPSIHPDTLRAYTLVGDPASIPELPDGLMSLWTVWPIDLLKSLDPAFVRSATLPPRKGQPALPGSRNPIAEFNDAHSIEDILSSAGYTCRNQRWLRPGSQSGVPGVVLLNDSLCYSHGGDALNDGRAHDAFDCYRLLNCQGDLNAALAWNPEITHHNAALRRAVRWPRDALSEPTTDDLSLLRLEGMTWPEPVLPVRAVLPAITADILPGWVGDMAGAVARSTQTPDALAVMMSLSVLATLFQRRFVVHPSGADDDYQETLSLWTLTVAESGSRKSAVVKYLTKVLVEWEGEQSKCMEQDIARVESERDVITRRIDRLKSDCAKENKPEKRNKLRDEIQQELDAMPAALAAPRLFNSDITGERLQQLMVEQGERMAILSDEGGIFQIMSGQYSSGFPSLDIYLMSHCGTPIRVDRGGRQAHIDLPALTIGLAMQPDILADAASKKRFRSSGLLARFLFAYPESNIGQRDFKARNPVPPAIADAWRSRVKGFLNETAVITAEPKIISFSPEALRLWEDFGDWLEKQQGAGQPLANMKDWTSKLTGAVASIATLLELAMTGTTVEMVSADSLMRSLELGKLLIPHAQAALGLAGTASTEQDALAVLNWIQMNKPEYFTARDLQRGFPGRFSTARTIAPVLRSLEEWGCISEGVKLPARGGQQGGRPSLAHLVNPKLYRLK